MNELDEIYKHLARDWPSEELAARHHSARDLGARAIKNRRPAIARALPTVASAVPPAATLTSEQRRPSGRAGPSVATD
jgi:hypothetical protein